jgi:hypothetical protein
MHDGVGSQGSLMTAIGTLVTAIAVQLVAVPMTAYRTHKAIGPFNCVQILHTGFFSGKTLDKLAET